MMDIKEIWRASTQKEPTIEDVERIKRVMQAANMEQNDSMAVVLTLISAQHSTSPLSDGISDLVSDKISSKMATHINQQVNEARQVVSITQQLRIVGITTIITALVFVSAFYLMKDKTTTTQSSMIEGCDTSGNMPIMVYEDKNGEKKCVLIGKDGKSARDKAGKPITWSY